MNDTLNDRIAQGVADALTELRYGHLPRRACTAAAPMDHTDKDAYRWTHADAVAIEPFFNLMLYQCPHCALCFTAHPREH